MKATIFILLLATMAVHVYADAYNYPVKSTNIGSALGVGFYTQLTPESSGLSPVADIQGVHGIQTADGGYVMVGKGLEQEDGSTSEAFALKLNSNGQKVWAWSSGNSGANDAANACAEYDGKIYVAGWMQSGSAGYRTLWVLDGSSGKLSWKKSDFAGDGAGSNGAWEMITLLNDGKDGLILSGFRKKPDLEEMNFKSYGNVPSGEAHVLKMTTFSSLSAISIAWTYTFGNYVTAKATRECGSDYCILVWGEESKQATLARLSAAGKIVWGPTEFGSVHGEGTDITVNSDSSLIAITGQGGTSSPKVISARLTLVNAATGARESTTSYSVGATPNTVFHECWGGVSFPSKGGFAMSCGTGIEGGTCAKLSGTDKSNCEAGKGDLRSGAYPRKENVWQSYIIRTDNSGKQLWARTDSYKESGGASLANGGGQASSASEWVILTKNNELAFVNDEVSGVGLLKLGSGGSSGGSSSSGSSSGSSSFGNGFNASMLKTFCFAVGLTFYRFM